MPPSAVLTLTEDATSVRLLIEGIYDAHMPVGGANVAPLLELSRKFDVAQILENFCKFLRMEPLTAKNLPDLMALACEYGIDPAVIRCQEYVADGSNFMKLESSHSLSWLDTLPAAIAKTMLIQHVLAARAAHSEEVIEEQDAYIELQCERGHEYDILKDQYKKLFAFAVRHMPDSATRQGFHLPDCECQACDEHPIIGWG